MALKDSYLTISQAAENLKVTRQTVSRWIAEGKLSAEKVGREKLIPRQDVESFGMQRVAPIFSLILSTGLKSGLGYNPTEMRIEGVVGKEPLRATVINDKGEVELVEIEVVKGKTGIYNEIRFKKVKQFRKPIYEPKWDTATKINLEVDETGDIVRATYKDMKRVADITKDIKSTKVVIEKAD